MKAFYLSVGITRGQELGRPRGDETPRVTSEQLSGSMSHPELAPAVAERLAATECAGRRCLRTSRSYGPFPGCVYRRFDILLGKHLVVYEDYISGLSQNRHVFRF